MEQDPKQKDTNTQKDTAKGHAGLLPDFSLAAARQLEHRRLPEVVPGYARGACDRDALIF